MTKEQWLDAATKKIRFAPDRDTIRRELAAHIEDLTDRYAAAGAAPVEAETQALREMGSAADIAAELGRIHRPWWGWLWMCSRYILLFVAFYALLYSFPNMSSRRIFSDFRPPEPVSYTSETTFLVDAVQGYAHNRSGHYRVEVLEEFDMTGRTRWGSYRFTAPVCWTETRNWDAGTQHWLVLYLHCATQGKKLDMIRANPRVFFELDCDRMPFEGDKPCQYGLVYSSVMGRGTARIIEDVEEKKQAMSLLMKTQTGRDFTFEDRLVSIVAVVRIDVEEYTAKHRPLPEGMR